MDRGKPVIILEKRETKVRQMKGVLVFMVSIVLILMMNAGSLMAQEEDIFLREPVVSRPEGIILSAVFPGLGQMSSGHKLKGITLFITEVAAAAFLINAHENYRTRVSIYESSVDELQLRVSGGNYRDVDIRYKELQDDNDELDTLNNIRNTALIVAAGIYVVNLVDAVLFTSYRTESRSAINKPRGRERTVSLTTGFIQKSPGVVVTKTF